MKVVFLDRDGVINRFPGNGNYVTKIKDFHFLRGSLTAIRKLTEAGYVIFVVSNQAGVGKGIYTKNKLDRITKKMLKEVKKKGGKIKKVFYCIHRSTDGCDCRKPETASIRKALSMVKRSLRAAKGTYFVGDTVTDMVTGRKAGCKTIFVLSGRGSRQRLRKKNIKPDFIAKNLLEASKIILNANSNSTRLKRTKK